MSLKRRLRIVVACMALEVGVMSGVPMRPEQIREFMRQMNQPTVAHVLPGEDDAGDDPPSPPAGARA